MKKLLLTYFIFGIATIAHAESKHQVIAEDLPYSWAIEFLPSGDVLLSERTGALRVIRDGVLLEQAISGVPEVFMAGQGGLLDVALDSDFENNQTLYLSYSAGTRSDNTAVLMSARLVDNKLVEQKVLFEASPSRNTAHHYAARILELPDNTLLFSVGDGFNFREQAQTLDNHFGKIVRINKDGSVPDDNPFVNTEGAKPEIYSYGHRNSQGLTLAQGKIIAHEHGPKGGDEVNIIEAGKNYGWPVITYGIDYNGAQITPFTEYEGMEQPKVDWTPSIAPSALTTLNGAVYSTALAERSLRQLSIEDDTVRDLGKVDIGYSARFRDITVGPDNKIYILTEAKGKNGGKLLKLQLD